MWRLLEVDEQQQFGDEMYNPFHDKWEPISVEELTSDNGSPSVVGPGDFPIRRRIDSRMVRRPAFCVRCNEVGVFKDCALEHGYACRQRVPEELINKKPLRWA